MKDYNAFSEEFHKEATRYLKELNDLFDKFKKSIAFTAIADDIKNVVTSSRKNKGKDDLATNIASVVSSSSVAAGLLLDCIQKLHVPIQNINLSKYTILSYNASRAKGSWGEFEKMKLVVDPLKPEEFKTACNVIRQLATFSPVVYDESSYNIRRFNFNEREVLSHPCLYNMGQCKYQKDLNTLPKRYPPHRLAYRRIHIGIYQVHKVNQKANPCLSSLLGLIYRTGKLNTLLISLKCHCLTLHKARRLHPSLGWSS